MSVCNHPFPAGRAAPYASGDQHGGSRCKQHSKRRFSAKKAKRFWSGCRTLNDAEKHLDLAPGTLADTDKDSDYIAVLKIASTIEPLVNKILQKEIKDCLQKFKVAHDGAEALGSYVARGRDREGKLRLARDLSLISNERYEYAQGIFEIRDRYAHNVANFHLSILEIAEKISPNDRGRAKLKILSLLKLEIEHWRVAAAMLVRSGMYYQFAWFLADALHILEPPRFEGLYDAIMAVVEKDSSAE